MTRTDAREVLDLYDVLPQPTPGPTKAEDDPVTALLKSAGRNVATIIGLFAVTLAAFIACVTLFSTGPRLPGVAARCGEPAHGRRFFETLLG